MQQLPDRSSSPSGRVQAKGLPVADGRQLRNESHSLARRLIQADEQLRTRIARDLHDDVAQRLSVLTIELSVLARDSATSPGTRERLTALSAQAASLGADLHRVTRELHPVVLQNCGLEAAVRSFCAELSRSRSLVVALDVRGRSCQPSAAASLCVYRVLQEALHNVIRHSGVSEAVVTLTGTDGELILVVADRGIGFDPDAPSSRASLGLSNMRARVQAVDGHFLLNSRLGEGTRIEARVPLP